jgi:lipid-binding SYLF domain-containing protein
MCQGRRSLLVGGAALALTMAVGASPARAASSSEIDRDVDAALKKAYQAVPEALELTKKAKAVIVFPRIYKAGFMTAGYSNTVAASYGFQAGVQAFGYMLFFPTDHGVKYLEESGGFELGSGPSIVVLDSGTAKAFTTSTAQKDIAAMFFDQKGLMGGVGLQGSKLSRMNK